jgi:hypothetical protein
MKSLARFAMVFLGSSIVGCGSEGMESEGALLDEENLASVEQALESPDWHNGDPDWKNDNASWINGANGWAEGDTGWSSGTNGWTGGWDNGWTTGWANAWSNAWGYSWDNGWDYDANNDGKAEPSFAWTESSSAQAKGQCAHPLSQTGGPLVSGCNPMATSVCNADSYCCSVAWDDICVREARRMSAPAGTPLGCYSETLPRALPDHLGVNMTIGQCVSKAKSHGYTYAGLTAGGGCYGGSNIPGYSQVPDSECNINCTADSSEKCGGVWRNSVYQVPAAHPVTQVGLALSPSHSACASAVITFDAFCGGSYNGSWDQICVDLAADLCVERYVTRPRLEEDRVVVDTCVETKIAGYPACPIGNSGENSRECCRRAMVLKGVYKRVPEVPGYGRETQWKPSEVVAQTGIGTSQTIRATLVPDPCYRDFHNNLVCKKMDHLWQVAGPGRPIYPDCSGAAGARPCNNTNFSDQMRDFGVHHVEPVPYRGVLLATMSSLITTTGEWTLTIRCNHNYSSDPNDPACSTLPFNSATVAYLFEASWTWASSGTTMTGKPACVISHGSGRTGGALVANIPVCNVSNNAPVPWPGNHIGTFFGIY